MKTTLLLICMAAGAAHAMEPLDDASLAGQAGQDGITASVSLVNGSLMVSQLGVNSKDGISATDLGASFSGVAGLVYAPTTYTTAPGGISLCTNISGACTAETGLLTFVVDAAASGSSATLNIGFSLPTSTRRVMLHPFSLYMSPSTGSIFNPTRTAVNANVREILKVTGSEGISILLADQAVNPFRFNIQLGDEPQGHMLAITSGKLLRIGNDPTGANPIQLISQNGAGTSSLKMDFDLCAAGAVTVATGACNAAYAGTTGLVDLSGFYMDLTSDGVVFGNAGISGFNIVFGNMTAGTVGTASSYDSLQNGSMGRLGLVGVQVTNMQMKVKGM